MTAPANDALLITLLAAFTACVGYAAGRLHQWYRTGLDRDEAYRDGYDTATRSVFSMAARLIGPKRAIRGTATVTPAVITTAPPVPGGAVAAGDGARFGSVADGLFDAGGVLPADAASEPLGVTATPALLEGPAAEPRLRRRAREDAVATPASATSQASAAGDVAAVSVSNGGGRHLVPDELVQAPTYRLAPDRVARAKVPGALPDDAEQETTRLPSVPRPRSS
ncbi:hypothetical protein AB0J80_05825 [Actinoplanes sp. NPDC049548]|uniref:hypothetical protein n=1 Tax=Actinoplanes sp. NPDC049548 TaxID=3155152 RepID=UPI0034170F83